MSLILLCPGFNPPGGTAQFRANLQDLSRFADLDLLTVPTGTIAPYDGGKIVEFLKTHRNPDPITLIGFSAGVVGAIAAAHRWQQQGGTITQLIALDGWGVPLVGDFPIYRLSHDWTTHWQSFPLGMGSRNFYADPPVEHLELWANPAQVQGWVEQGWGQRERLSAIAFIAQLLALH